MMLQQWLYNLGLGSYKAALHLAAPLVPKAKKMVDGRKGLLIQIQTALQTNTAPVAWFHCASLGEFEQGRPLIEALRAEHPQYKILLTFFSPSGYEIRKNYAGADWIFYLPLDSSANAKAFMEAVKPKLAVFVKYEFWHYYLQALRQRMVPTLLVSAIFRPNQAFFKPQAKFYRQMLHCFSHLFVQDQASAALLSGIGVHGVSIAGDTRFDRVLAIREQVREIPLAKAFANDKPVMVVGSSWPADIEVLTPLIRQYRGQVKFIIAPHEIDEKGITQTVQSLGVKTLRFTESTTEQVAAADVLLVDTIGMLSSLYALGQWAYVGGSFGKGLHNTLEAAVWGIPVFFGSLKYQKFAEAKGLIAAGAAYPVANSQELLQHFSVLFEDKQKHAAAGQAAARYVAQQAGATTKIMTYIQQQL